MIKHNKQFYPESFFWNDTEIEIESEIYSESKDEYLYSSDNDEYKNNNIVKE